MKRPNSVFVIYVIRQFVAAIMAISLLLVSTVPTVSAAACAMPGIDGAADSMTVKTATTPIDWQDCYIECGCRIDNHIDGMPHQLAPHALSMDSYDVAPAMSNAITITEPAFTSLRLPFPTPPPRTI